MTDDTTLPFTFPAVGRKKVTAAFDGGRITSDGGVMLLAEAERRLAIAGILEAVIPDHREPSRTVHALADILRARIFAIACGYEDADDLDSLRSDPAFKLACCRIADAIYARSRRYPAGRTRPTCAASSGSAGSSSICGSPAIRRRPPR